MRNFSVAAHDPLSSLNGYALQSLTPEVHAASYDSYGKLHALGGSAAVIAAASAARDLSAFDEWSGGFDIHLGVYTQD
jgi:hypothetical protein